MSKIQYVICNDIIKWVNKGEIALGITWFECIIRYLDPCNLFIINMFSCSLMVNKLCCIL